MSTITASLGIAQIEKLDKIIKKRRENAHYLSTRLSKNSQIIVPQEPEGFEHIFQMYTVRLPNEEIRNSLHDFLTQKKIFSKVYFDPIHLTTYYVKKIGTKEGLLPITERISQQVLTLPLYPNMTNEEKDYLLESIFEFFESH